MGSDKTSAASLSNCARSKQKTQRAGYFWHNLAVVDNQYIHDQASAEWMLLIWCGGLSMIAVLAWLADKTRIHSIFRLGCLKLGSRQNDADHFADHKCILGAW